MFWNCYSATEPTSTPLTLNRALHYFSAAKPTICLQQVFCWLKVQILGGETTKVGGKLWSNKLSILARCINCCVILLKIGCLPLGASYCSTGVWILATANKFHVCKRKICDWLIFFIGLTALDLINDFDEWIECGFFTEEIVARLKGNTLVGALYIGYIALLPYQLNLLALKIS